MPDRRALDRAVLAIVATVRQKYLKFPRGSVCAISDRVAGVRRYEDLDTWKLSVQLRDRIFTLSESGPAARNQKLRDQIRDASSSAPRNIAEGFGRFRPKEFAYFARIARGSLVETKNHLQDIRSKGYFPRESTDELLKLVERCIGATTELIRYLDSCGEEAPTGWGFTGSLPNPPHHPLKTRGNRKRRSKTPNPEP